MIFVNPSLDTCINNICFYSVHIEVKERLAEDCNEEVCSVDKDGAMEKSVSIIEVALSRQYPFPRTAFTNQLIHHFCDTIIIIPLLHCILYCMYNVKI